MASDLVWQNSSAPTHGTIGDINTMRISSDYLGMAQDVLIDQNGTLRSRGGFRSVTTDTFTTNTINHLILTSTGALLLGRDTNGETPALGTASSALTGFSTLTSAQILVPTTAQTVIKQPSLPTSAKMQDNKGAVLAFDYGFISGSLNNVSLWGGNAVTTSDTTAGTAATTIGIKAVTGAGTAWTSALEGCYLFIGAGAAAVYVGQVDQVTSTTALLLKKGALKTIAAAAPAFKTIRPAQYVVYKGRVTTNTASAVVVGSNTKFNSSGPGGSGSVFLTNSVSNMFRYSDGAFIGQITSVQNDTTLTLSANAALALANEEFYITNPNVTAQPGNSAYPFYFIAGSVARFADRYWYGCFSAVDTSVKAPNAAQELSVQGQNSVIFTKKNDPECLDLDPSAGDILSLAVTHNQDRIRGLCATRGGLVVFRSRDTWLITGYSPETFRAVKIADDGISVSLSFREYNEGVIWGGSKSVWYFDGTRVVDLLRDSVRKFYQRLLRPVDLNFPLTMAISNDHVIVSFTPVSGGDVTWPVKNGTGSITHICMAINLLNGAVSFFTNLAIMSSTFSDALGTSVILARNTVAITGGAGFMVNGSKIFVESSTAADNFDALTMIITLGGITIGPSVMFETTKLTMGDASRIKFWKRFLCQYSSDVSMTATFIGTNDTTLDFPNRGTGSVSSDTLAASSNIGILHRLRFLVRSPVMSIRIYQTSAVSAASQKFKMQWWSVGGKRMRQGRAQP